MIAHTPGPWAVFTDASGCHYASAGGKCIHEFSGALNIHNARLIAAAPDLLEAVRDMLSGWKYIRESHGDLYGVGWDRAQEKAEAAIAKATGGAV